MYFGEMDLNVDGLMQDHIQWWILILFGAGQPSCP
jgi:hypothetical protein